MTAKHIVIIGSGIGGITFAEKFHGLNPESRVTVLTKESYGYYSRPMLSHGFSKPDIENVIILKPFERLKESGIQVLCNVDVTAVDRGRQCVTLSGCDDFETLAYDKLIIATGSAALIPPPFLPYRDLFFVLNSLADLKRLRKFRTALFEQKRLPQWAIIGGGLIGCEVASDLAVAGDNVTLFHAMDRLMERQLLAEDSETLQHVLQSSGLKILLNQSVQGFERQGDKICVTGAAASEMIAYDGIIVSCGFKPRISLAKDAGLCTARGIKVSQFLQTDDKNIFALGDVAELPNGKLYAFILPIRSQALWLADYLAGKQDQPWSSPTFNPKAKVHGFEAANPYIF